MNSNEQYINTISLSAKGQGAFLAAAVGDALGWSQELEARRIDKKTFSPAEFLSNGFKQWVRQSGGQYYPHQEVILPGEYSDDTQLILCTARSLLYGTHWWHHLTKQELPTWTYYERGGGGATKRSAKQWLAGIEPWSSDISGKNKQYFDAGGNGVAMRILPHCLFSVKEENFDKLAKDIVANGVTTHGHPRALVGALAYGFAVWIALRETNTLKYGAIIEKVLSEVNCWSALPKLNDICPTWKDSALQTTNGQYEEMWQVTIKEMLQLLELCQEGMKQGSLPIEKKILTQLGCFDKRVKGSGTISAAAAIFLASRFAANPLYGLLEAGFARGSDTDTLASMAGGILGAVAGIEWLGNYTTKVQDANYIRNLAEYLAINYNKLQVKQANDIIVKKGNLEALLKKIEASHSTSRILLPDGRKAQISDTINLQSMSKLIVAKSWRLTTDDGQSLYIKKINRMKNTLESGSNLNIHNQSKQNLELQPVKVIQLGIEIPVTNMDKSRFFYEQVLGIKAEQESKTFIRCGSILLINLELYKKRTSISSEYNQPIANAIDIVVASINEPYNNVVQVGARIVKDISQKDGRRFFSCCDPDENIVMVYEVKF